MFTFSVSKYHKKFIALKAFSTTLGRIWWFIPDSEVSCKLYHITASELLELFSGQFHSNPWGFCADTSGRAV